MHIDIIKMGDPCLQYIAQKVTDFADETLKQTIDTMIDTMRFYQGVGLAAPQIGLSQQIIVLEVNQNIRYPQAEAIALEILINPNIIHFSTQTEKAWEGCLSLPKLRGNVARSLEITYEAMDANAQVVRKTVSGFHARIIQHEIDHLNGILYPQRLENLLEFGYEDSLPTFASQREL